MKSWKAHWHCDSAFDLYLNILEAKKPEVSTYWTFWTDCKLSLGCFFRTEITETEAIFTRCISDTQRYWNYIIHYFGGKMNLLISVNSLTIMAYRYDIIT